MRPADILAAHEETRTPTGSHCTCGEWQTILFPGGVDIANWSWATHLLDVVEAAGWELVRKARNAAAADYSAAELSGSCIDLGDE